MYELLLPARIPRTGDSLTTGPAAPACTRANGTALQFIPRSRETNNPSSAATYQASLVNAISFTMARKGTINFTGADVADFDGALAPRADAFFAVASWSGCDGAAFSISWFAATQEAFDLS